MIHIIMVLMIKSRYFNHRSRGSLNGTDSVINTLQIRTNLNDCYQTNQLNVYQKQNQKLRELSNCRINAYSVANAPQTISFKYSIIILFETHYLMIYQLSVTT